MAAARKPLPALLAFTDPTRTPDVLALARSLPRNAALVYRAFGAPDALAVAQALRAITRVRRVKLLIGADAGLAVRAGADGVHLPERLAYQAVALKRAHPGWIVTAAAHGPRASRVRADALVVSAIFPSRSPSAGPPLGPIRLAILARRAAAPVYALGGINDKTARRLLPTGVIGIAAVEGLRT
jgi:thiamine-phosphate pyrophosphorylase